MHGDGGKELVTGIMYPRQNGTACEWSAVNCCARVMTALEAHLGGMLQTTVTGFAMGIVLFVVMERASWDTPKFFKMLKDNFLYDEHKALAKRLLALYSGKKAHLLPSFVFGEAWLALHAPRACLCCHRCLAAVNRQPFRLASPTHPLWLSFANSTTNCEKR